MERGDIVELIPEFYRHHAPMVYGVVEDGPEPVLHRYLITFIPFDKSLWLQESDVVVRGHVDD